MANVKEQFGLRPYRKLDGTPLVGAQNRYTIASNMGHAIFQGDLVVVTTAGNIEKYNNTNNSAGLSTAAVGVFNGVFYTDPTTQKPTYGNYYPGSIVADDITAFVVDDPDAVFLANADICQDPDNSDTATSNANILVRINHHQYRSRTGI
jgi:hypothetical protein